MHVRLWVASIFALLAAPYIQAPSPSPASVTKQRFRQLQWIAGQWRGSGGSYAAFFEEYRVLDDSTVGMRSFSDSTLRTATDSSVIEWRNGRVQSRSARSTYVAVEFTSTTVRFARPGAAGGGHTFSRVSANEWKATLHPASTGGQATVYTMRRIRR
jgi:hypothetical protein